MHVRRFGSLIALSGALLTACSSAPVAPPKPPTGPATSTPSLTAPAPVAAASNNGRAVGSSNPTGTPLPAYLDPNSPLSKERSVFFDFDVFTIKSDDVGLVERHGRYLASQPGLAIKVEGNADERGSSEYNLALGQKRAQAVVQALKLQGVKDSQLEAVSWGKERPRSTGHDEAAWAENRRADLVYPKQ